MEVGDFTDVLSVRCNVLAVWNLLPVL